MTNLTFTNNLFLFLCLFIRQVPRLLTASRMPRWSFQIIISGCLVWTVCFINSACSSFAATDNYESSQTYKTICLLENQRRELRGFAQIDREKRKALRYGGMICVLFWIPILTWHLIGYIVIKFSPKLNDLNDVQKKQFMMRQDGLVNCVVGAISCTTGLIVTYILYLYSVNYVYA